jgi:membrane fusion protein (multidrug efflux system)
MQAVKVGAQIATDWIVESGLKAGDRIVVEGTQGVKESAVVNPKPFTDEANSPPVKAK